MKRKIARGRLIFTCVWLAIFAVAYVLWAFYLSVISGRLTEYEYTHPENKAERVFEEYFLNADPMTFSSYDEVETKYDEAGTAKKFYYDLTFGKALAFSEHEINDDVAIYSVTADGVEFARIELSADSSHSWSLSDIVLTAFPEVDLCVVAPKSAVFTVNGVLISEEYIVSEYLLEESPVFGGSAEKREMVKYTLSGVFGDPTLSVKLTAEGVELGLDKMGDRDYSAESSYISYLTLIYYTNNQ